MSFEIPGFSSISSFFSGVGKADGNDKTGAIAKGSDKKGGKPETKGAGDETVDANGMMFVQQGMKMMDSNVEGCKGQLEANVAQSTESGKNAAEQVKGDGSNNKNAKPAPSAPSAAMPNPMMGA